MSVQSSVIVTVLNPVTGQEVDVELNIRSNIFVSGEQTILNVNGVGSIPIEPVLGIN
jgi:hypothetical protein